MSRFDVSRRRLNQSARGAFTLIELLLVLVILAILAAVIVPRFTGKTLMAKQSAAKADISSLKVALNAYEIENGQFPTTQQGLQALIENPGNLSSWTKHIDKLPNDPWGHPYVYRCPGSGSNDFDLISCGPDGNEGGGDDID